MVNGNVGDTGNVDDPALILGDLNDVTVSQIGAGNIASLIINTPGTGATVVVSADGSSNTQSIGCGTALSASCNASIIRSEITGNSNNTVQMLTGNAVQSKISINGSWNNVTHTATGAGLHSGEIIVSGSGVSGAANAVTLTQSGAMTKNAVITSNGSNNNVLVVQSD
jgi:TctA family transporter